MIRSRRNPTSPHRQPLWRWGWIAIAAAGLSLGLHSRPRHKHKQIAAISGSVFLPNGMLAAGAEVDIHTLPKGRHWTVYSNEVGDFLQEVPIQAARYQLRATLHGYAPGLGMVEVPGPQIVNIFLHLGKLAGTHSHH